MSGDHLINHKTMHASNQLNSVFILDDKISIELKALLLL